MELEMLRLHQVKYVVLTVTKWCKVRCSKLARDPPPPPPPPPPEAAGLPPLGARLRAGLVLHLGAQLRAEEALHQHPQATRKNVMS